MGSKFFAFKAVSIFATGALALPGLLGASARAATYYVDSNYAGSTSNGTKTAPWKTLGQVEAFASYADGDVIAFARGRTWRDQLDVPRSRLTFTSYDAGDGATAKPILSGAKLLDSGWTAVAGQSNMHQLSLGAGAARPYVVTFHDAWGRERTSVAALTSDKDWYWNDAGKTLTVKDLTNPNTGIEAGQRPRCVNTNNRNNLVIQNLQLEKSNSTAVFIDGGANVTLQSCTLRLCNSAPVNGLAYGGAGVFVNFSPDALIDNNSVSGMRGDAVFVQGSTGVRVTNNLLSTVYKGINEGGDNIQLGGRVENGHDQNNHFVITGNTCSQQNTDTPKGCIITELGNHGTIAGNTCSYGGFGIAVGGSNLLIERNTLRYQGVGSTNPVKAGFLVGGDADNTDYADITFRYNVIHGSQTGITMSTNGEQVATEFTRSNVRILNNTITGCDEYGIRITTRFSGQIRNNIVWCPATTLARVLRVTSVIDTSTAASHNLIGPNRDGFNEYEWDGATYGSASAFMAGTGFTQVKESSPLWASEDPAASNFLRLSPGSPARDAGTDGFYVPGQVDRAGNNAKVGSHVDFGAYEYQGP